MIRARGAWLAGLLVACAAERDPLSGESPGCRVERRSTPLPAELRETSGLAASRRHPGILWTHNDSGGEPVLYAVRPTGELVARVQVRGASNVDWEDVALGPCGDRDCLFIADIGDNDAKRSEVVVYRVPEPDPGAAGPVTAEPLRLRYADGPRDAEALFVLPSGELFVVSKGRESPVTLYRRRGASAGVGELEPVVTLTSRVPGRRQQVTAADAAPSGRWVAVRSYEALHLYRVETLLRGDSRPALRVDLAGAGEAQGEALAIQEDGTVWLSSEGALREAPGLLATLRCALPAQ